MTLDLTVNTDFAQVEADEEQVTLTRFALFFPEKRPFFLENAQTFQFGHAQAIDLFFSRRIGLSERGVPIPIIGGGRLSGKVHGFNVGMLNMQTRGVRDERNPGTIIAPSNNFSVVRVVREIGRSNIGAAFVNRAASGDLSAPDDYNRGYGLDAAWQASENGKLFAFIARTDSPARKGGSDYAGRAFYSYANPLVQGSLGYSEVGKAFNPRWDFLYRQNYRRVEGRLAVSYDPERWDWIRRINPHSNFNMFWNRADGKLETGDAHLHFFDIMQSNGGRFGYAINTGLDRPRTPYRVYAGADGRNVAIPSGEDPWAQGSLEFQTNQSAPFYVNLRQLVGTYYDGNLVGWDSAFTGRAGTRFLASVGWNRSRVTLPHGDFTNDLVPMKIELFLHAIREPRRAAPVQQPGVDVFVEYPLCAPQPQRHGAVCRLQQPAGHHDPHAGDAARPIVHREDEPPVRPLDFSGTFQRCLFGATPERKKRTSRVTHFQHVAGPHPRDLCLRGRWPLGIFAASICLQQQSEPFELTNLTNPTRNPTNQ